MLNKSNSVPKTNIGILGQLAMLILATFLFLNCGPKGGLPPGDSDNGGLFLPDDFEAVVVVDSLRGRARHLTVNDNGDIYVKLRFPSDEGGNAALRDTNNDGKADIIKEFDDYIDKSSYGTEMRINNGYLYFSSVTRVYRQKLTDELVPDTELELILTDTQPPRQHDTKLKDGSYSTIKDPLVFADVLTKDVQSFNNDRHMRVIYDPERIAQRSRAVSDEERLNYRKERIASLRKENYGFKEVTILEGNVGYLDLRNFRDPEYAGETAISAMGFLSNTDAIIVDVRNNGGGTPLMVQLITSYFFGSEPVHLNSFYTRQTVDNEQFWTLPHVPGKRRPDVPVYVLTSSRTFSAAEEFSYNLRNLERAILVGETTGGGAHPGGTINATEKYNVWTPTGRAINPITNTNWEGTGVAPHIKTTAKDALLTAQIKALDSLKRGNEGDSNYYDWHIETAKAKMKPMTLPVSSLKTYEGIYGIRTVSLEDNALYYQRAGAMKYRLIPINNDTFRIEEMPDFRIHFKMTNGNKVSLVGLNEDGSSRTYKKGKNNPIH